MPKLIVEILSPKSSVPASSGLTKDDVWGRYNHESHKRESEGMIVARTDQPCPVWGDIVPFKSVTLICTPEQEPEVIYWLEYVHGGESVERRKDLEDGRVALRSNYMCF